MKVSPSVTLCTFEGCGRVERCYGLCATHNGQRVRGEEIRPFRSRMSKGQSKDGYIRLRMPEHPNANLGGTVYQHIFVMAEVLGRPLVKGENVHHVNGNRSDNRPENLELWNTSQPPGQRIPDKVAYAKEILALYGDSSCKCNQ